MIPVAYWGCCTANKSLQADSYQINWDFRILSILSGSKNLRWNSPPGEKLQQTSLGCRSTRIPPLFRLDIWAFDKGTAVAKAKLSDVEARSQQGGGGGATRPPDLPISCPSPTGLVTPDTGVPKVTQSTLPSTPTSEDYLDELIWRRDTHRTLFAHFCRGGQKKKIIMIKERLPSSPELKNKWETPGKSGKKILVRTTNCFNSLWWRRINA